MDNLSNVISIYGKRPLVPILIAGLLSSCSFGPPETRAYISNVRAKPDSQSIAVAVRYEKFRSPTGFINTFPNGGIPKILDQEARIYLCDAETAVVKRIATVTPEKDVQLGWEPWVMGWVGDSLHFKISGQSGTRESDIRHPIPIIYCLDATGRLSMVREAPEALEFQSNTGPLPQHSYVRYTEGHKTIDVRTKNMTEARTLFKIEANGGELVSVSESSKPLEATADAVPQF